MNSARRIVHHQGIAFLGKQYAGKPAVGPPCTDLAQGNVAEGFSHSVAVVYGARPL